QSPIKIVLLDPNNKNLDSISYEVKVSLHEGKIKLSDNNQVIDNYTFGKKFITPIGAAMLVPNSSQKFESNMVININPIQHVIDNLLKDIQVTPNKEKQSFIVNFSLNHPNRD